MKILGVKIDSLTMAEVLQKIESFLEDGQPRYIVTVNPEFLVKAQQDEEFRQILNQADLAVPDGIGLVLAAWFLGRPFKERVTGVDLMEAICQVAAKKQRSVCLCGAKENVAEKAAENLIKKYPELKVENQSPKILFVALGAPKQEKWIVQNLEKIPSVKLAIGVGGAFDYISGQVRRAPKFLRLIGLEWFWRLFYQPWRIKRVFNAVIKFPWLVLKSK